MNLFHRVMNAMGRHRLILDRKTNEVYMDRYYLFLKNRKKFPFNITIHTIKKSDDPIFHDHPWGYLTIVIKNGYWEHTPIFDSNNYIVGENVKFKGPGSIICRSANEYHWLELDGKKPATTLFFMGPQKRDWGFLVELKNGATRWVEWTRYLSDWQNYHATKVMRKSLNTFKEKTSLI